MAKKLVYNYTFSASAQTVAFTGLWRLRSLILITNVTTGVIIYNFADPTKGGTTSYDSATDTTTLTLEFNTTSMSDTHELQILVDEPEVKIDASESLLDPVNKFRVSEPQNLIDTDFEYGLQPTKWETIELVDNIPSVYVQNPGVSIGEIQTVDCTNNSNVITVTCGVNHGLSTGDPIEVQGTSSRTANGKYLVTAVLSQTSFNYVASAVQSTTQNLKTAYTTIIPGSFFSGSNIIFDSSLGVETDDATPSTLKLTMDHSHGLSTGTSLYITNTVGKRIITLSNTSATAADGQVGVNTTTDTIYAPAHNLYTGQIVYVYPDTVTNPAAVLPTASPTPADPSTTSSSSIDSIYTSVSNAVASIQGTMGSDWARIYMNYPASNDYAIYTDGAQISTVSQGSGSADNTQNFYYGDWANNNTGLYLIANSNMSAYYQYVFTPFGRGNNILYTGTAIDLGQYLTYSAGNSFSTIAGTTSIPANLAGRGIYFRSTKHTQNAYTNNIITITQLPNPATVWNNPNAVRTRWYNSSYLTKYAFAYDGSNYTVASAPVSAGSGWTYTYYAATLNAGFRSGHIKLNIRLENTGFGGYSNAENSNWSITTGGSGAYSLESRNFAIRGTAYQIEVLISLKSYVASARYGQFGSVITTPQMVSNIVNQVISDNFKPVFTYPTGINTVRVVADSGNRLKLRDVDRSVEFDFTTTGTGPIKIETQQTAGINDNSYSVTSTTNNTVSMLQSSRFANRQLTFTNNNVLSTTSGIFIQFVDGHGLINTQKVTFTLVSGSGIGGLTNGATYYAIVLNDKLVRLASSVENATAATSAITTAPVGSGSYRLDVPSLSGRVAGTGIVGLSTGSKIVTGTGTKFTTSFRVGDKFIVAGIGSLSPYLENTVSSVVSDTTMSLTNVAGITTTNANHFVDTKVYVRADGAFLHRPFDGGVEITAGTSPDSQIVRQTRKYFRYQSGKGIQCSVAINFNPYRAAREASGSGTTATITTEYPHGLTAGNSVKVQGASDSAYNGTFTVDSVTTFTFTYTTGSAISSSSPTGFIEYTINGYSNAATRCGLFDFQNGFFYEYDGSTLYAVRRSSTQQLSGTITCIKESNTINGTNTRFQDQLTVGSMVVIRGQSYKVTAVPTQTQINIQPAYRGISANSVVVTKTVDTKIPQSQWNVDKCDGTGPSGYTLDINKIQMAYFDYSWYGAGKIRFGFKDTYGHVKYMHEFVHNNKLNEAYMRSGNIPARYEIVNTGTPTFIPSLFHWGTSVIMDGKFDNDDSYLFTASGKTLTFTNGDAQTATTTAAASLFTPNPAARLKSYYLKLSFATTDASKFSSGVALYTTDGQLNGQTVSYTSYGSGSFDVYVFLSSAYSAPAIYPTVSSGTSVSIGALVVGTSGVDLSGYIPLLSIRLAPSADNNLIGAIGERDIVNRMQLKLKEMGISVTHDATISVILNGSLSNLSYTNLGSPSLTQYIAHDAGDTIGGGTVIYSFRASGGAAQTVGIAGTTRTSIRRYPNSAVFSLKDLSDLGNSILGGDAVFPDGPDIITIAATVVNTAEIDSSSSFQVSSRISWSESQA